MKRPKYRVISIRELKRVVNEVLKQYDEIQIAYLYGSYAQNYQTEFSDVDIGVVLKKEFIPRPLFFAELASKIEKEFNYSINIDLRIINNATPRFKFQIIKNGIILYSKEETFKDEYVIEIINQYLDIKPMLDMFDNIYIREVLGDEY